MSESNHKQKNLGKNDIVLFTISAILLLDTLAAGASVGASSLFWWIFLGIIFFCPFALICAEMGCSYPKEGGIYAWIRDAYSRRWATRASWCYWVNTAVWLPAIYILFAGVFKQSFFPELGLGGQIGIGIALTWLAVWMNSITMDFSKWVPNIGALVKLIIFIAIIIGAICYTRQHGMANPLTWETIRPDWGSSLQYIPALIYGMLGFELVSATSNEMKNPARDVPRAIFISGTIILLLYTLGTAAVLAAIPASDINLVEGLVDTLRLFFGGSTYGNLFVLTLSVGALFTFFSNGVTWSLGCNRAAAEAAKEGELPKIFAYENPKTQTPIGAAVLMGIVSTATLVLYGLLSGSNEDLFWSLFSFSAVIFLLPYLGMMLSFVKLRVNDPLHPRPYKIPGGLPIAYLCAGLCFLVLTVAIVLFIYTPGEGLQLEVLAGIIFMLGLGEITIQLTEKNNSKVAANREAGYSD